MFIGPFPMHFPYIHFNFIFSSGLFCASIFVLSPSQVIFSLNINFKPPSHCLLLYSLEWNNLLNTKYYLNDSWLNFPWWRYCTNDLGWQTVGGEQNLLLILSFTLEKNPHNLVIVIVIFLTDVSYIDGATIDDLIQSPLETCRSLSSNFNGYWLNLE